MCLLSCLAQTTKLSIADPDPELTRLGTIPAFYPIMRGSLNIPTSARDSDLLDKLDHRNLLMLCLRYQEHLKQLAEAVAFDQNALCIRIKEVDDWWMVSCRRGHSIIALDKMGNHDKYFSYFQTKTL